MLYAIKIFLFAPHVFLVLQVKGEILNITAVRRDQMGAYFCVASNGVPPSISKRIMLIVQCEYTLSVTLVMSFQRIYFLIWCFDQEMLLQYLVVVRQIFHSLSQ